MKEKGLEILLNKFFKITNKKITAVFYNNDYLREYLKIENSVLYWKLNIKEN